MFATIIVPNFYLQGAMRHEPQLRDKAVGVLDGEAAKAVLIEINDHAQRAGVYVGMTPSQALARCLQFVVKTRSAAQEQCITEILIEQAFTLAPFVEATAPGVCTVQFTDTRDVEAHVRNAIERLTNLDIVARAGIAQNADTSLLAAHLATPVLRVGDVRTFLARLPIESLASSDAFNC